MENQIMFEEYIKIPFYFNADLVESVALKEFLGRAPVINNMIELNYLKSHINVDIIKGLEIITELRLRGFIFHTLTESRIFYNNVEELNSESKIIYKKTNENNYKHVDIKKYYDEGVSTSINSDLYFNLIPLVVFKEKATLVEKEFSNKGFSIIKVKDLSSEKIYVLEKTEEASNHNKKLQSTLKDYLTFKYPKTRFNKYQINAFSSMFKAINTKDLIKPQSMLEWNLLKHLREDGVLTLKAIILYDTSKLIKKKSNDEQLIEKLNEKISKRVDSIVVNYLRIENFDYRLLRDDKLIKSIVNNTFNNGESLFETLEKVFPNKEINTYDLDKFEDILKTVSISNLFYASGRRNLEIKEFFNLNRISNMNGLINFDFNLLGVIDGVGKQSVNELQEIYLDTIRIHYTEFLRNFNGSYDNNFNYASENNYKADISEIDVDLNENANIASPSHLSKIIQNHQDVDLETFKLFLESFSVSETINNPGRRFKDTLNYFRKNNINNLRELSNFDFSLLRKVSGLGGNHIKAVKSLYLNELDKKFIDCLDVQKYIVPEIYLDYKVNNIINIDDKDMTIRDFYKKYNELNYKSYKNDLFRIKIYVYKNLDLNLLLPKLKLVHHSERDLSILEKRLYTNETLQDIGDTYNVTRERVRQVSAKLLEQLATNFENYEFSRVLKKVFNDRDYIHINELRDILDEDNIYIIGLLKGNHIKDIFYLDSIERLYLNGFDQAEFRLEIQEFLEEIPILGMLDNLILEIKTIIIKHCGLLLDGDIERILLSFKIFTRNNYFTYGKPTIVGILNFILKYKIKEPLRIDENNIQLIQKYSKEIIGDSMKERSVRNWEAPLQRSEEVYLVGPRTYLHKDHQNISIEEREVLDSIIKQELKKEKVIPTRVLMDKLDQSLDNNPFISNHHLYSFVKDVYSENIKTARGNLLDIYPSGVKQKSRADIILEECNLNNGVVKIKALKDKYDFNKLIIENAVINSPSLDKIGNDSIMVIDQVLTPIIKNEFQIILDDMMIAGYNSVNKIYNESIFDITLNEFFNKYNLTTPNDITNLLKIIDPKISGHTVFLYYKDQGIKSIEDYIIAQFEEYIYREEIIEILEDFGFSTNSQINLTTQRLISDNKIIRVSTNKYQKTECFKLPANIQNEVLTLINNELNHKDYIVLNNYLDKIIKATETKSIIINQYILEYILSKNGYKKLKRFKEAYNEEIIVMIKENINYDSIDQLVRNLLANDYAGVFNEAEIFDYLVSLGIYNPVRDKTFKTLKQDMFEHDLISVDLLKE